MLCNYSSYNPSIKYLVLGIPTYVSLNSYIMLIYLLHVSSWLKKILTLFKYVHKPHIYLKFCVNEKG